MWGKMRDWLEHHGCIPNDERLVTQLTSVQIVKHDKDDRLIIESKDDMKARGLESPDDADALAMTFAFAVPTKERFHDAAMAVNKVTRSPGNFAARMKERAVKR